MDTKNKPAPAQSREEALALVGQLGSIAYRSNMHTPSGYAEMLKEMEAALRARLASAQSSAQGEGAREIVAARDEEWKAWIKAKGFNLEPLAGCL